MWQSCCCPFQLGPKMHRKCPFIHSSARQAPPGRSADAPTCHFVGGHLPAGEHLSRCSNSPHKPCPCDQPPSCLERKVAACTGEGLGRAGAVFCHSGARGSMHEVSSPTGLCCMSNQSRNSSPLSRCVCQPAGNPRGRATQMCCCGEEEEGQAG